MDVGVKDGVDEGFEDGVAEGLEVGFTIAKYRYECGYFLTGIFITVGSYSNLYPYQIEILYDNSSLPKGLK